MDDEEIFNRVQAKKNRRADLLPPSNHDEGVRLLAIIEDHLPKPYNQEGWSQLLDHKQLGFVEQMRFKRDNNPNWDPTIGQIYFLRDIKDELL